MLLLPVAQSAAICHELWHAAQMTQQSAPAPNEPLSQISHCALCLTVAAIHGGALPSAPMLLPSSSVRHEAPLAVFATASTRTSASPYRSRAPPVPSL
jgi:hypothetical protein